jgi:hypothetical protein
MRCSLPATSKMTSEIVESSRQIREIALELGQHQAVLHRSVTPARAAVTAMARYAIQSPKRV